MESDKGASNSSDSIVSSPPSHFRISSLDSSTHSGTQIGYCIRTVNFIISTLHLPIPQITALKQLTVEILLRIHCALLGIDFSKEFIPAANPTEDVKRMILSLKDRFGADKFGALEPKKIAEKNPTQLRFLIEHFHLILNHQLTKAGKSKPSVVNDSGSDNYLSITQPSTGSATHLKQNDGSSSANEGELADSFETVENVVVNIFEETASSLKDTRDPLFTDGVTPGSSRKPQRSNGQPLMTSSPIVHEWKTSIPRSSQRPSPSTPLKIRKNARDALAAIKNTANPTNPTLLATKNLHRHQGFPIKWKPPPPPVKSGKTIPSIPGFAKKSVKTVPRIPKQSARAIPSNVPKQSARAIPSNAPKQFIRTVPSNVPKQSARAISSNVPKQIVRTIPSNVPKQSLRAVPDTTSNVQKNFPKSRTSSRKMPPFVVASGQQREQNPGSISATQFISESDEADQDEVVQIVGKIHTNIRNQISESLVSIDKDISELKRKPPKPPHKVSTRPSGTVCTRKKLPNLRWLMPVDLRFPDYTGGVIIPKCTDWRANRRSLLVGSWFGKETVDDACDEDRLIEELSILAQQGSGGGVQSDDVEYEYDDEEEGDEDDNDEWVEIMAKKS